MNREKTLKERFKQEEKEHKEALMQENLAQKQQKKELEERREYEEHFKREIMLFAKKIDKMTSEEYTRFINATIKDLTLLKARSLDCSDESSSARSKINTSKHLDSDDVSKIVLSHAFLLSSTGALLGFIFKNPEFTTSENIITGAVVGGNVSLFSAFTHFALSDGNYLINKLNAYKAQVLARKSEKLNLEYETKTTTLQQLEQSLSSSFEVRSASHKILRGVYKQVSEISTANLNQNGSNDNSTTDEDQLTI